MPLGVIFVLSEPSAFGPGLRLMHKDVRLRLLKSLKLRVAEVCRDLTGLGVLTSRDLVDALQPAADGGLQPRALAFPAGLLLTPRVHHGLVPNPPRVRSSGVNSARV
jgi:hypothetical protein